MTKVINLEYYDENSDEDLVEEYYRICPVEVYEIGETESSLDSEFEEPEITPAVLIIQTLGLVHVYRATIDAIDEIPELIEDIENSRYKQFEIHVQENCYGEFYKSIRSKFLGVNFEFSKVDGYVLFKMDF